MFKESFKMTLREAPKKLENLDAIKARLGSISKTKMETFPIAVQVLLMTDLPAILKQFDGAKK